MFTTIQGFLLVGLVFSAPVFKLPPAAHVHLYNSSNRLLNSTLLVEQFYPPSEYLTAQISLTNPGYSNVMNVYKGVLPTGATTSMPMTITEKESQETTTSFTPTFSPNTPDYSVLREFGVDWDSRDEEAGNNVHQKSVQNLD